jgi:hypothetical protein
MPRDEKLIIKILQYLNDKESVDSYRLDIDEFDMNIIIEQLEICHKENLISVSNKLLGALDETVAMEGIKITQAGKTKINK